MVFRSQTLSQKDALDGTLPPLNGRERSVR
jgi:hypothetical protein